MQFPVPKINVYRSQKALESIFLKLLSRTTNKDYGHNISLRVSAPSYSEVQKMTNFY